MTGDAKDVNPVSYDAAEAGEIIGKSANWMKTQARAGNIPFTRLGRTMRWTPQHLAQILRDHEQRPRQPAVLVPRAPARKGQPPKRKRDAA